MNRLEGTTKLRIVDVTSLPGRPDKLLVVEHVAGERPSVGMVLRSPEVSGSWQITTFGLFQPDPENPHPDRLSIGVIDLLEGAKLIPGVYLVQS
jgi:hypothetical protein